MPKTEQMSDIVHRHMHECPECGRTWECFRPGGCRDEEELSCLFCDEEDEEEE